MNLLKKRDSIHNLFLCSAFLFFVPFALSLTQLNDIVAQFSTIMFIISCIGAFIFSEEIFYKIFKQEL